MYIIIVEILVKFWWHGGAWRQTHDEVVEVKHLKSYLVNFKLTLQVN